MAIRTTDTIRDALGGLLEEEGFSLEGKWPRWTLERTNRGLTDKVQLLSESAPGHDRNLRHMNVNFAVCHARTGREFWMNRPYEEWFEYRDEERLGRELKSQFSRIAEEVLPWMEHMRSKLEEAESR